MAEPTALPPGWELTPPQPVAPPPQTKFRLTISSGNSISLTQFRGTSNWICTPMHLPHHELIKSDDPPFDTAIKLAIEGAEKYLADLKAYRERMTGGGS